MTKHTHQRFMAGGTEREPYRADCPACSAAKHTPGPCKCYVHIDKDPKKTRIVHCPIHAAAPEGVELAKHIVVMADDAYLVGHPEWEAIVKEAQSFLAKAEGRE